VIVAAVCLSFVPPVHAEIAPTAANASDSDAEVVAGRQKLPGLKLEISAPQQQYEQGEPIEVTMRYTYTGERKLNVEVVGYNRGGRITEFGFTAMDDKGQPVRDPVTHVSDWGGLRSEAPLNTAKPYEQRAALNEWLAFGKPGRYTLMAHSHIVWFDNGTGYGGPRIPLESGPLQLQIIPPDDNHRLARLLNAKAVLDTTPASGEKGYEARERAVRDLRFMMDERAIPLLVKALEDPIGNVVNEAEFGLRGFRDLSPVKAALLKVVNDDSHTIMPNRMWSYISLLAEADAQTAGGQGLKNGYPAPELTRKWQDFMAQKFKEKLPKLPPAQAAQATVEGLAQSLLDRSDVSIWKRLLDNPAVLTPDVQQSAAYLLRSYGRIKSLQPDLKAIVANTNLDPELRAAALVTLHELGDDSFRDQLVKDITSAHPIFWKDDRYGINWKEPAATLGRYRATEIEHTMLGILHSPTFQAGDRDFQMSVVERVGDFSAGATVLELQDALRWMMVNSPYRQEPILNALAARSPEAALPFIRDLIHDPKLSGNGLRTDAIRTLLSRTDTPAARALILEVLQSQDESDRESLAEGFSMAVQEGKSRSGMRLSNLKPAPGLAESFMPEMIAHVKTNPSRRVQAAMREALEEITGIPGNGGWEATATHQQSWIPLWEAWWEKNRTRFVK
ncbi:MAG: hypothetical protein M3Y56_02880, partial [Armatimonadota bacterium]|nr:hypothetical protein [Armatimonadota bacterium]